MLNISTSFHPHLATPNPETPQPNLQDQTSLLLQKSHDLAWQPPGMNRIMDSFPKQNPLDIAISTQIIARLEVSWLWILKKMCAKLLLSELPLKCLFQRWFFFPRSLAPRSVFFHIPMNGCPQVKLQILRQQTFKMFAANRHHLGVSLSPVFIMSSPRFEEGLMGSVINQSQAFRSVNEV